MSKENVFRYLEQQEEELADFLKKLISIHSENPGIGIDGPKEKEIQEFLKTYLTENGFQVEMFSGDSEGKRFNVCAVLPGKNRNSQKNLILNGHVDTVPVTEIEKWDVDPYGGAEIDGNIYGRGANDMKGGLAAAVFAAKAIREEALEEMDGDVILMLSAGEESCEGGTIGARACVQKGYRAPFAIVCEPTSLELHHATCSLLCFELVIHGKAIHIGCRNQVIFPQSAHQKSGEVIGVDAVEKALPFMEFFYRLEKEWNHRWNGKSAVGTGGRPGHDDQGVGAFVINPSFIESGTYIGSVPGSVKITYALWHPPEIPYEEILQEIRDKVAALASTDMWLKEHPPEVIGPVSQLWKGFITDIELKPVRTFRKAFEEAMGAEPIISGFRCTCDGTYLEDEGIPSIICGPGAVDDGAHGYNEFVSRQEVLDAAKIYAGMIYDWCR